MDTSFIFHRITELDIAFQIRKWRRNLKLELQTNIKLVIRGLFGGYLCVEITDFPQNTNLLIHAEVNIKQTSVYMSFSFKGKKPWCR